MDTRSRSAGIFLHLSHSEKQETVRANSKISIYLSMPVASQLFSTHLLHHSSIYFHQTSLSTVLNQCQQFHNHSSKSISISSLDWSAHQYVPVGLTCPCACVCVCLCVHPQAKSERNYHIFYEMLAGLPPHEKHPLYLQEAETYYYLNQVLTYNPTLSP